MLADAAVIDQPQAVQQQCPPQHAGMRLPRPFPFDQARQRKNDRRASDENEQREDEIIKPKPLPWDMMELKPKEMADAAHDRPFAGTHVVKRPDGAVAAENPEDVEPAQRVDRRNSPHRRKRHALDETLRRQLQLHVRGSFAGRSKSLAPAPRITAARLAPHRTS